MFQDDFQEVLLPNTVKRKQVKREFSAGFKNYHPPKQNQIATADQKQSDEADLFAMLKIGNLKQLYLQSFPKQTDNESQMKKQQLKRAIERLTSTKKMPETNNEDNEQENESKKLQRQQKFMKAYRKEQGYQQKAHKILFKAEFQRVKEKLIQLLTKKSKQYSFTTFFASFIISKISTYKELTIISNDQLILDFNNFLNRVPSNDESNDKQAKIQDIKEIGLKNIFLFGFLDAKKCQDRYLNKDKLALIARNEEQEDTIEWKNVEHLMEIKITVPYESDVSQQKKNNSYLLPKQIENNSQTVQFHAQPIPKSTYQKPLPRPKSHGPKTIPQPFSLTVGSPNLPKAQNLYNWNRNFQANQIPQTTYKPQQIKVLSQDEKKMRALELLHSSNYPSSMKYLNNLKQVQQKKQQQLFSKFQKKREIEQVKPVPNFEAIHKRHLAEMESIIEKREITQPQPFKLSEPRERKQPKTNNLEVQYDQQHDLSKKRKPMQHPKVQPPSTLKFDAYVSHIKHQKQQKIEKEEKKKKQELSHDKSDLKQILKNRVYCEIGKTPKPIVYSQDLPSNPTKVDLQTIYNVQPLLMEREAAKSSAYKKPIQKNWQPII